MIEVPEEDKRRAATRLLAEALAQGWPITAGLAHIYRFTHPTEMERALGAWRREITDTVNEHERLLRALEGHLFPRSRIGPTALALAMWLTENSPDGLQTGMEFEDVCGAFSEASKGELEEACFELRHLGLIEIDGAVGRAVDELAPTYALYWAFDSLVLKTDPLSDARLLAGKLLEDESFGNVARLDDAMGWSRRRLNPSIARLMPLIGTKSDELQNRYPTTFFSVQSEDRFHLKRFVRGGE